MKNRISKAVICIVIIIMTVISSGAIYSFADGTHGFYMDCDSSVTNHKSKAFMIDFYSDSDEGWCTYWSNANWSMYLIPSIKKLGYSNMTGGGAYAGLQIIDPGKERKGIMSIWRYEYRNRQTNKTEYVYAKAVYGTTTTYDNEGSGTSCVMPFDWKSSHWIREMIYCWEDAETGYTFIGNWYYDYVEDKWSLFAYYNTFLVESYIKSDVGQFLENFSEAYRKCYRSFRYRNIYFLSNETNEWVGSPTVALRSDGNPKAWGETAMGISEDGTYLWASVDGNSEIDSDEQEVLKATLVQDEKPTYGTPSIETYKANCYIVQGKKAANVSWELGEHSTPQLSYKITLTDADGNEIASKYATRPHETSALFEDIPTDEYKAELEIVDVFGQTTTQSYETDAYKAAIAAKESDTDTDTDTDTDADIDTDIDTDADVDTDLDTDTDTDTYTDTDTDTEKAINKTTILCIAIAGAIVVAVVIIVIAISKKKKKQ